LRSEGTQDLVEHYKMSKDHLVSELRKCVVMRLFDQLTTRVISFLLWALVMH